MCAGTDLLANKSSLVVALPQTSKVLSFEWIPAQRHCRNDDLRIVVSNEETTIHHQSSRVRHSQMILLGIHLITTFEAKPLVVATSPESDFA